MPIGPDEWERGEVAQPIEPDLPYRLKTFKECKCCVHPDCVMVNEAFMRNEMSGEEAAAKLGVSPAYFSIHINRDVVRPIKEQVVMNPIVHSAVNDTLGMVTRMRGSLGVFMDRLDILLAADIDAKTEFRIKAISSEIRGWVELMLKLEGQLSDSPMIVIQDMKMEFNQVMEVIMSEASPEFKRRLIPMIANLDKYR